MEGGQDKKLAIKVLVIGDAGVGKSAII